MFRKLLPPELQLMIHRAIEVVAFELQYWSGCWAYWPEDDPSLAREIAEFPTVGLCQQSLKGFERSPDRRSAGAVAESLSHARQALAALDGEAYCLGRISSSLPPGKWIDVAPALRICDDALLALRDEGIHVTTTSTPPRGGPSD
jgi:hypothetical protein